MRLICWGFFIFLFLHGCNDNNDNDKNKVICEPMVKFWQKFDKAPTFLSTLDIEAMSKLSDGVDPLCKQIDQLPDDLKCPIGDNRNWEVVAARSLCRDWKGNMTNWLAEIDRRLKIPVKQGEPCGKILQLSTFLESNKGTAAEKGLKEQLCKILRDNPGEFRCELWVDETPHYYFRGVLFDAYCRD